MKKISVMIVDDEKLAIDDIVNIIDWKDYGFEIVATAFNGKQALNKFNIYRPQVVITDIRMPYMDGIELVHHLRKIDTKTKILLLTAYKDFSYAKSAIQYGITEYIIKSEINSHTLNEILTKLHRMIDSEDEVLGIVKQKSIADFFNSNMDEGQLANKELFLTPYCYLIIEQDLPTNITEDSFTEYTMHQNADIISVLTTVEERDCITAALSSINQNQILVVVDIKENSQKRIHNILFMYAEKIKMKLKEQFQSTFTIYTYDIKTDLIRFKTIYISGRKRFYAKYLLGNGDIYPLTDKRLETENKHLDINENMLSRLIERMDAYGLQIFIDQLFRQIHDLNSYMNLYNASRCLYDVLRRNNMLLPEYCRLELDASKNWFYWFNGKDIFKWFNDRFQALIAEKKRVHENDYSKVIIKALDYIYNNYHMCDLSINHIADNVHLSVGHLCALFKKETGKTVNRFITEVRINEARKLLRENEHKICDISLHVGYRSSQYFSKVFHMMTGVYPIEFKKRKN
jgi:two-component system response regulator YesN